MDNVGFMLDYIVPSKEPLDALEYLKVEECSDYSEVLDGWSFWFRQRKINLFRDVVASDVDLAVFFKKFKQHSQQFLHYQIKPAYNNFTEFMLQDWDLLDIRLESHTEELGEVALEAYKKMIEELRQTVVVNELPMIEELTEDELIEEGESISEIVEESSDELLEEDLIEEEEVRAETSEEVEELLEETTESIGEVYDVVEEVTEEEEQIVEGESNDSLEEAGAPVTSEKEVAVAQAEEIIVSPQNITDPSIEALRVLGIGQVQVSELLYLITGRRSKTGYNELTDREFSSAIKVIEELDPTTFQDTLTTTLKRFWRMGETHLVSQLLTEMTCYMEEVANAKKGTK